jgi:hypothetical protein
VGFLERLAGQTRSNDCCEVRALEDVVVSASQRMLQRDPGDARLGDLIVQVGDLSPDEVSPGDGRP